MWVGCQLDCFELLILSDNVRSRLALPFTTGAKLISSRCSLREKTYPFIQAVFLKFQNLFIVLQHQNSGNRKSGLFMEEIFWCMDIKTSLSSLRSCEAAAVVTLITAVWDVLGFHGPGFGKSSFTSPVSTCIVLTGYVGPMSRPWSTSAPIKGR